jgi:hypothetical protein
MIRKLLTSTVLGVVLNFCVSSLAIANTLNVEFKTHCPRLGFASADYLQPNVIQLQADDANARAILTGFPQEPFRDFFFAISPGGIATATTKPPVLKLIIRYEEEGGTVKDYQFLAGGFQLTGGGNFQFISTNIGIPENARVVSITFHAEAPTGAVIRVQLPSSGIMFNDQPYDFDISAPPALCGDATPSP